MDFDIFQGDNLTTPYKTVSLGWDSTANNGRGAYVWAPGDTMTNVTYAGYPHQIGTRWVNDFSIATGLMLTTGEMNRLGLNKSLYPSAVFEGETYYILEPGHDYTIKEHQTGTIGYEFDFIAPVYHPMLIDGVLRNVEVKYTTDDNGKITAAEINGITGSEAGLSGLEIENTLRGYINLNKVVVDKNNEPVESDNTRFEYTIKLDTPTNPGPFTGTHIPWYGVNGLYYNDGHETYYQVYEAQNHKWMIRDESGREYELTSTGFDVNNAEEQTVTYSVNGQPKELKLYGNQMTASNNGSHAEAILAITQKETLYIANIPVGTTYTITESNADEYTLIDILKEVKNGKDVEQSEHASAADLSNRKATGKIVTNRDNHVTYTNKVLTGELKITKEIRKNGTKDGTATGTFYYAVYDEPYDPAADPAQEPVRTGHIDVTANGTAEITEPDLKIGTYYVYELTGEGGTPVISGEGGIFSGERGVFNGGRYYAVTTSGSPAAVALGGTSQVDIVNNYETAPVTAAKTWADKNPQKLTVYFKLFYKNSAGVAVTTGMPLVPMTYENMSQETGIITHTWNDMPVYDENGRAYEYIVREYVIDDTNGEFEEGEHRYTEAAPNGYVNTEAGLSVTNSKLETYEPVTTYSGLKVWVDTVNGGKTRPDSLTVLLKIDNAPYGDPEGDVIVTGENGEPLKPDWVTVGEDRWRYTFTKLPMFDEQKNIIQYYAEEIPAEGYAPSVSGRTDTLYVYIDSTLDYTENDAYPVMSSDADLVYTAVRKQFEGHLHHIWTQRIPTDDEKGRLVALVNSDLVKKGFAGDATKDNVRWVSGLPINHEFIWKAQPDGYKVSFTRHNTNTIHVKVDNHGAFDNICYGTLKYNYTAGSTDFRNELQPVTYDVEKTWGDEVTPPDGAVVVVQLQGTVQIKVEAQPAEGSGSPEEPEPQYQTVPVDIAALSLNQKIQVTLNGGIGGGDDTAQDPWKYHWSNLPPCDKDGHEITYSIREISYTIGGHTVNLKDFVPSEDTSEEHKTILTNQIPSFGFDILKISAETADVLPGAKFTILPISPTSNMSSPVPVGEAASSVPETTGENGRVSFNDIPLGYYEVEETAVPRGFVLTEDGKFYVRVDTDGIKLLEKVVTEGQLSFREVSPGVGGRIKLGNVELTKSGNTVTFTVENTPGLPLPNTGGPGTGLFTILGSIIAAGAGLLLWRRRRLI